MLPSMPILFSNSQDAFGTKPEPSTSFFHQHLFQTPPKIPTPPPVKAAEEPPKVTAKETKAKSGAKKKDQSKQAPPKIDQNALETALVKSYYTKVQSKFSSNLNVPTNKFNQFQNILKSFDPSKETPVDLYRKIEQLFGETHSDFVEEFLLFLKRGQAAQVGRFMDHFMLTQLTGFIEALQTAYARKPTVHRKIVRALTTGINTGNSEQMKARVLPHLRSNPRLAQAFRSLFPDERPPDSCYESHAETLSEAFLTSERTSAHDTWQLEMESAGDDRRNIRPTKTTDTMYLHGRVFLQHGRMLRSARVTFPYSKEPYRVHARRLAADLCHLSPPESDDERASPKRQAKTTPKATKTRAKKQPKSPTKTAKDVNDNTSKECAVNSPRNRKSNRKVANKKSEADTCRNKKECKEAKKQNAVNKDGNQDATKAKQARLDVDVNTNRKSNGKIGADVKKSEVLCLNVEAKRSERTKSTLVSKSVDAPSAELRTGEVVNASTDVKKSNWTRDEDKTMLQVLKGEPGSEQIFGRIKELLPHRSPTEIKERFCHVMNLLQQMAVGEVT